MALPKEASATVIVAVSMKGVVLLWLRAADDAYIKG